MAVTQAVGELFGLVSRAFLHSSGTGDNYCVLIALFRNRFATSEPVRARSLACGGETDEAEHRAELLRAVRAFLHSSRAPANSQPTSP